MAFIKVKDFYDQHYEYRMFFARIVEMLAYDLRLSLLVTAFLLWLEERNAELVVVNLFMKPTKDVVLAIMETQCCIDLLVSEAVVNPEKLCAIFPTLNISLRSLCLNKHTIISRIKRHLRSDCARLFSDIICQNLYGVCNPSPYRILNVPGFPDPVFGRVNFVYLPNNHLFDTTELVWSRHALLGDEDDRSLYVTFSRGLPVSESEVRRFFTRRFGNCVEIVDMAPPTREEQLILFARVVMRHVEIIDRVLGGNSTARFKINVKYIFAKKYKRNP